MPFNYYLCLSNSDTKNNNMTLIVYPYTIESRNYGHPWFFPKLTTIGVPEIPNVLRLLYEKVTFLS